MLTSQEVSSHYIIYILLLSIYCTVAEFKRCYLPFRRTRVTLGNLFNSFRNVWNIEAKERAAATWLGVVFHVEHSRWWRRLSEYVFEDVEWMVLELFELIMKHDCEYVWWYMVWMFWVPFHQTTDFVYYFCVGHKSTLKYLFWKVKTRLLVGVENQIRFVGSNLPGRFFLSRTSQIEPTWIQLDT